MSVALGFEKRCPRPAKGWKWCIGGWVRLLLAPTPPPYLLFTIVKALFTINRLLGSIQFYEF